MKKNFLKQIIMSSLLVTNFSGMNSNLDQQIQDKLNLIEENFSQLKEMSKNQAKEMKNLQAINSGFIDKNTESKSVDAEKADLMKIISNLKSEMEKAVQDRLSYKEKLTEEQIYQHEQINEQLVEIKNLKKQIIKGNKILDTLKVDHENHIAGLKEKHRGNMNGLKAELEKIYEDKMIKKIEELKITQQKEIEEFKKTYKEQMNKKEKQLKIIQQGEIEEFKKTYKEQMNQKAKSVKASYDQEVKELSKKLNSCNDEINELNTRLKVSKSKAEELIRSYHYKINEENGKKVEKKIDEAMILLKEKYNEKIKEYKNLKRNHDAMNYQMYCDNENSQSYFV